eukprot:4961010-Pyramimonas_sp.AAC.1
MSRPLGVDVAKKSGRRGFWVARPPGRSDAAQRSSPPLLPRRLWPRRPARSFAPPRAPTSPPRSLPPLERRLAARAQLAQVGHVPRQEE